MGRVRREGARCIPGGVVFLWQNAHRTPCPGVQLVLDAVRRGLRYRFAGFELEPGERRLLANGDPVALTPKVFDTLVLLVENTGHLVSRDEFMRALWPRGCVTEHNLDKQIWAIRKALATAAGGDLACIETVPKLGYRFTLAVEREEGVGTEGTRQARRSSGAALPATVPVERRVRQRRRADRATGRH